MVTVVCPGRWSLEQIKCQDINNRWTLDTIVRNFHFSSICIIRSNWIVFRFLHYMIKGLVFVSISTNDGIVRYFWACLKLLPLVGQRSQHYVTPGLAPSCDSVRHTKAVSIINEFSNSADSTWRFCHGCETVTKDSTSRHGFRSSVFNPIHFTMSLDYVEVWTCQIYRWPRKGWSVWCENQEVYLSCMFHKCYTRTCITGVIVTNIIYSIP